MPYRLVFLGGKKKGDVVPLEEGRVVTLGRSPTNDIWVPDSKISRIHCQIEIVNDLCAVSDLNSTNGTYLNGDRIQEKTLQNGDQITLGLTRLRFEAVKEGAEKKEVRKKKKRRAAALVLCSECGGTILQSDLDKGAAKQIGSGFYCSECASEFADVEVVEEEPEAPARPGGKAPAAVERPPVAPERAPVASEKQVAIDTIASFDAMLGEMIGGHKVLEKLAEGRLGNVYKAEQVSTHKLVALKILSPSITEDEEWVRRFLKEADVGSKLSHPNIVVLYDSGKSKSAYYIAMEFVDGASVADLLHRQQKLTVRRSLNIITQVTHALDHAHRSGVFHTDIRPSNVLVSRSGVAKLSDFGLASTMTVKEASKFKGLQGVVYLRYAPPEQFAVPAKLDARSDLYSLGATLYHMITGRPPFVADSAQDTINKICSEEPVPPAQVLPEIPKPVSDLVIRLLAKAPSARYPSAADLLKDLEQVAPWDE
ncbi:MAG: FHA domain-containing protein [Planctomycetes bacterium]|nr:FHA domain-containing protein [Planctomycetota bacterium]